MLHNVAYNSIWLVLQLVRNTLVTEIQIWKTWLHYITPSKSDFVQYWELGQASKAEIADGKYLKIEGYGTVIGYSIMPNKMVSLQIQNVLYVPEANKRLFSLIAARQRGSMSQTTGKGYNDILEWQTLYCWPAQVRKAPFLWHGTRQKQNRDSKGNNSNNQWLYLMA